MVKLTRVERACERTGNSNCPLVSSQQPIRTKLYDSTAIEVHDKPSKPNTPVISLDANWKPKNRILFVYSSRR